MFVPKELFAKFDWVIRKIVKIHYISYYQNKLIFLRIFLFSNKLYNIKKL